MAEDFNSKYSGEQVEELLDQVARGGTGGGSGTTDLSNVVQYNEDGQAVIQDGTLVDGNRGIIYALPSADDDGKANADYTIASEEYVDSKVGDAKKYVKLVITSGSIQFKDDAEAGRVAFSPNTVYYADGYISESISIIDVVPPTNDVGEYTLHFTTDDSSEMVFLGELIVPSNWLWANGSIPTLEKGCSYELSVIATKFGSDYIYKAILTPFKAV